MCDSWLDLLCVMLIVGVICIHAFCALGVTILVCHGLKRGALYDKCARSYCRNRVIEDCCVALERIRVLKEFVR